jgi:hypothetical protein
MQGRNYNYAIVYLIDEEVYGERVMSGAYASLIKYKLGGFEYISYFANEDFDVIEEVNIEEIEEN